jgi:hypothetical protein
VSNFAPAEPGGAGEAGEIAVTSEAYRLFQLACPIAMVTLASLPPTSARADFFDDARRTFQTDIPHFFQDDVPCAFGGQPTSHTKSSCKSPSQPAKPANDKDSDRAAAPSDKPPDPGNVPPSSSR